MENKRRADEIKEGEEFYHLEFTPSKNMAEQFVEACDAKYGRLVFLPFGMIVGKSNITQSPSFYLPDNVAAVHARDEIAFFNELERGHKIDITWKVKNTYVKRGRFFQVKECEIRQEYSCIWVLCARRIITDTYMGDSHLGEGTTKLQSEPWESNINQSSEYYLSEDKVNLFSGGSQVSQGIVKSTIHTDICKAKSCGLVDRVASGAMLEGYILDLLWNQDYRWFNGKRLILNFVSPATPETRVRVKLAYKEELGLYKVWCSDYFGNLLCIGTAEA